jgi:pimeloyl-ACP methyl ester carboxylesterase
VSGDSLYVTSWGRGPEVVLLHGLGASSRYWESLAAATSGFQATAPDLLGFGRSPSPPEASYDIDCHLAALAPHLPERAVVVAHSTGAILAAALAAVGPWPG